jgi:outer membrane biogenesis lipoprotein LolB
MKKYVYCLSSLLALPLLHLPKGEGVVRLHSKQQKPREAAEAAEGLKKLEGLEEAVDGP